MGLSHTAQFHRFAQLFRYYQAALVNTAFGYGLYALMIWFGVNMFLAQIVAQVLGVTFNYFSYSRHVFRDTRGSKTRFIGAYIINYFVNLFLLAFFSLFVVSAYIAGFVATICASLINYFALKHIVFVGPQS